MSHDIIMLLVSSHTKVMVEYVRHSCVYLFGRRAVDSFPLIRANSGGIAETFSSLLIIKQSDVSGLFRCNGPSAESRLTIGC